MISGAMINRRLLCAGGAALVLGKAMAGAASAQESEGRIGEVFSNTIIPELGYPEFTITVGPSGVVAPAVLEAGYYCVTLTPEGAELLGYLDIVQPPAGLDEETERSLMLDAGRNDIAQPDWVYVGGTNSPNPGESATFIVQLLPGDYKFAASYYTAEENSEEIMTLVPCSVSEAATPTALGEPAATVTVEETDDLRYIVSPSLVLPGPAVWKITNTGMHHAHHLVMMSVPDTVTAEDIIDDFTSMMLGTPTPPPEWMTNASGFGYAALQSGGQTTWAEFDLEAGSYALICYIMEPGTFRPHLMDGMVTVFHVSNGGECHDDCDIDAIAAGDS